VERQAGCAGGVVPDEGRDGRGNGFGHVVGRIGPRGVLIQHVDAVIVRVGDGASALGCGGGDGEQRVDRGG
jgi:hypothetical protein